MSELTLGHESNEQFTQRFVDAVTAVQQYNRQYVKSGNQPKHFLTGDFGQDGKPRPLSIDEKAAMEKDLVVSLHADDFSEMGIDLLELPNSDLARASMLGTFVRDFDLFSRTLERLEPDADRPDETAEKVMAVFSFAEGLVQAAYPTLETEETDVEVKRSNNTVRAIAGHQLRFFLAIENVLIEKGFNTGDTYERLGAYAVHLMDGTLSDYREAEDVGLVGTSFGPAEWQRGIAADDLNRKWMKAFNHLKSLRDREEPSSIFYTELFNKLRADFDASLNWLSDDRPDAPRNRYRPVYLDSLQAAMAELAVTWTQDFPLENTFYISEHGPEQAA